MGKASLTLAVSILTLVSCSTPSGSGTSRCAEINYTKSGIDEHALLADLRQLVDIPGVAVLADYTDGDSSYLAVYITPGHDLDVREKVSALGWQRVGAIPASAKMGSRVFGTHWSF